MDKDRAEKETPFAVTSAHSRHTRGNGAIRHMGALAGRWCVPFVSFDWLYLAGAIRYGTILATDDVFGN